MQHRFARDDLFKHPSMKIDQNYYCFACGAKGDAVNYVAVLFGLSQFEAAKKINDDFSLGISIENTGIRRKQNSGVRESLFPDTRFDDHDC